MRPETTPRAAGPIIEAEAANDDFDLDDLVERNSELAAAVGACDCWGDDPGCPFCEGLRQRRLDATRSAAVRHLRVSRRAVDQGSTCAPPHDLHPQQPPERTRQMSMTLDDFEKPRRRCRGLGGRLRRRRGLRRGLRRGELSTTQASTDRRKRRAQHSPSSASNAEARALAASTPAARPRPRPPHDTGCRGERDPQPGPREQGAGRLVPRRSAAQRKRQERAELATITAVVAKQVQDSFQRVGDLLQNPAAKAALDGGATAPPAVAQEGRGRRLPDRSEVHRHRGRRRPRLHRRPAEQGRRRRRRAHHRQRRRSTEGDETVDHRRRPRQAGPDRSRTRTSCSR